MNPDVINNRYFSIPGLVLLTLLILTKGADIGMKALYVVVAILIISIVFFFLGTTEYNNSFMPSMLADSVNNPAAFFTVFAICFPAFTGMTAGVGLSGDLKDPSKSIPRGTLAATLVGMVVYVAIAYKLASSASATDLNADQLIMSKIAVWGPIIPIGLAAATISSALGSFLVAPRTLQALARDKVFPSPRLLSFLSKGKGAQNEPFNASLVTAALALVFVAIGDVNFVAEIISMFFMVTYGSLCLISFFQHFSGDPAYRPTFRSKWYISLFGGILCFYLMFQMNSLYAFLAILFMVVNYFAITFTSGKREGIAVMFQGVITQFTRRILVFLQKAEKAQSHESWRPAVISLSQNSFQSLALFNTMKWISHKYGFGTYIHLIDGYFSSETQKSAEADLTRLIKMSNVSKSNFYIDTLVSPSFTSAIAQLVQLPGISGQDNNMILFEYSEGQTENLERIAENIGLIRAAKFDLCLLRTSEKGFGFQRDVHVWITPRDIENANLTIVLGYIIIGHRDWNKGQIKVFAAFDEAEFEAQSERLNNLIISGRLPVSQSNLKLFAMPAEQKMKDLINETSNAADMVIMGFNERYAKGDNLGYFSGYGQLGNILFVGTSDEPEVK